MRSLAYEFNCGQDGSGEPACVAAAAGPGTFGRSLGWPVGGPRWWRGVHLRAGHVQLRPRRRSGTAAGGGAAGRDQDRDLPGGGRRVLGQWRDVVDVAARLRRRWRARLGACPHRPQGADQAHPSLARRIAALDAAGASLLKIAALTGVSTATVRVALGRVAPRDQVPVEPDVDVEQPKDETEDDADLVVLAPPVPRTTERVAARFGDLVEAPVVI